MAVSTSLFSREYSTKKASKMNDTKILKRNNEQNYIAAFPYWHPPCFWASTTVSAFPGSFPSMPSPPLLEMGSSKSEQHSVETRIDAADSSVTHVLPVCKSHTVCDHQYHPGSGQSPSSLQKTEGGNPKLT